MRTEAGRDAAFTASALLMLISVQPAFADPRLIPYASTQAEYNSNLFSLADRDEALQQNGDPKLADTALRQIIGIDLALPIAQQKLRGTLEARRFDFLHFEQLNHDEHLIALGMDWRLGHALDGLLDHRQEERMAPFADRSRTDLSIERERITSGTLNLAVSPRWQLQTGLRARAVESPLSDAADISLEENSARAGLRYQTEDLLHAGVFAEYIDGQFDGRGDASDFRQQSVTLVIDRTTPSLSNLNAEIGYTRRQDQDAADSDVSAVTGALRYRRQLTGKTSAELWGFRRVLSYVADVNSVVETGVGVSADWAATSKIALNANYRWSHSTFERSTLAPTAPKRRDDGQTANLKLRYQLLPWLSLRPYAGYLKRDSNLAIERFDARYVGIELAARLQ